MNKHVGDVKVFATVEGRSLAKVLRPLAHIVERRNTYPILGTVRLTADENGLTVEATDLDIFINARVDLLDVAGAWSVCVDSRLLASIARLAGPMTMRMEPGDSALRIDLDDGAASYELTALAADGFPGHSNKARGDLIERFTNGRFAECLAKCRSAISKEETRYYLNGVNLAASHGARWFCATDGHRLIKYAYAPDDGTPMAPRILPRKLVDLICLHFVGADVAAYAVDGDAWIDLEIGEVKIRAKLIEGTFPDVHRVIPAPDKNEHVLTGPRESFIAALRMLTPFGSGRFTTDGVRIHAADGKAVLSLRNVDMGEARVSVDAEWPERMPDFGLNRHYLLGLLRTCDSTVSIAIYDNGSPILIHDGDDGVTRVIMPMRV